MTLICNHLTIPAKRDINLCVRSEGELFIRNDSRTRDRLRCLFPVRLFMCEKEK